MKNGEDSIGNNEDSDDAMANDKDNENNVNSMDDVISQEEEISVIDMMDVVMIVKKSEESNLVSETHEMSHDGMQNTEAK